MNVTEHEVSLGQLLVRVFEWNKCILHYDRSQKKTYSLVALLIALHNALNYELGHQDSSGTSMKMCHCYVTTYC